MTAALCEDGVSEQLLRTISETLDVRQVFPEISEVASAVLRFDRASLCFDDDEGHIVVEAASNEDFPQVDRVRLNDTSGIQTLKAPFWIAEDLTKEPLPIAEPAGLNGEIAAFGYRSLLRVHVSARDERIGLAFWAKRPRAFTVDQVPIARRVADYIALAVSHQQLAEAARQIAEERARAERLEARVRSLTTELDARREQMLGQSPEWQLVVKHATQVAPTETSVLLQGESGTGKEVIARFIHRASSRRDGPFVALNCAALPEQLLESELFGYERGAFTGALSVKPGQIELAAGGVLFLDEISEMTPTAQAKFLRVLQEREFQRLGGTRILKANVRVIAATNRDLSKLVVRQAFREDLYFRLCVFEIRLPPLRERRGDVVRLSQAFLEEIGKSLGRPPGGLTRDAVRALEAYAWPGNVRELRNALERACILCDGGLITAEHLALPRKESKLIPASSSDLRAMERRAIAEMLEEVGGNKSEAARRLGLSRTQLYVRLRKYDLERSPGSVGKAGMR
jgi:transcriptional regulator with GAF, ATPase, and Fis domain